MCGRHHVLSYLSQEKGGFLSGFLKKPKKTADETPTQVSMHKIIIKIVKVIVLLLGKLICWRNAWTEIHFSLLSVYFFPS